MQSLARDMLRKQVTWLHAWGHPVQPKLTPPVKARGALCLPGPRSLESPTCSQSADSHGPHLDRARGKTQLISQNAAKRGHLLPPPPCPPPPPPRKEGKSRKDRVPVLGASALEGAATGM